MVKKQIIGALAIIFNAEGKVLITRRHQPDSASHGKWQLPGGGVEFGEHPLAAVIREIQEEVNVEVEILTNRPIIYSEFREPMTHLLFFCYPGRYISGDADVSQDEETSEAVWLFPHEVDYGNGFPGLKETIDQAIKFVQ